MIKIKDIIKDLELGKVYTDKDRPPFQAESVNEDDLGLTYKKGKTIKVKHKTSGKSIVITDKPAVIKKYEKLGFYAESVNEGKFSAEMVNQAVGIAFHYRDNMTKAVKAIEKMKRGLSKDKEVAYALRTANESVNEVQKRQATDVAVKFDKAYLNFSREIRDIIKMVVRITGNRTDGKIFDKAYRKQLIPFDALFKSWYKGQQDNPHIKEKVSSPFSKHLINAQNEIEYMISEHNDAEDEGVYSKPHEAIKLLQIAQKSLGKIK